MGGTKRKNMWAVANCVTMDRFVIRTKKAADGHALTSIIMAATTDRPVKKASVKSNKNDIVINKMSANALNDLVVKKSHETMDKTSPLEKPSFVPLKPIPPSQAEVEAEELKMRHFPLPPAYHPEDIYKGRKRSVEFEICKGSGSRRIDNFFSAQSVKSKNINKDKIVAPSTSKSVKQPQFTPFMFDRLKPEESDFMEREIEAPRGSSGKAPRPKMSRKLELLLSVMADVNSNCVVTLGNVRLDEQTAKRKLQEFKEYQEKKTKGLIKINKRRRK